MQNLSCYNECHLHENEKQFHINGFVLSLALKQTLGRTRKWPIFCGMRERGKSSIVLFHIYIVLKFKTMNWKQKTLKRYLTYASCKRTQQHVAKRLTGFKLCTTTCNRLHKRTQHVSWELLAYNVASVCTGLYFTSKTLRSKHLHTLYPFHLEFPKI